MSPHRNDCLLKHTWSHFYLRTVLACCAAFFSLAAPARGQCPPLHEPGIGLTECEPCWGGSNDFSPEPVLASRTILGHTYCESDAEFDPDLFIVSGPPNSVFGLVARTECIPLHVEILNSSGTTTLGDVYVGPVTTPGAQSYILGVTAADGTFVIRVEPMTQTGTRPAGFPRCDARSVYILYLAGPNPLGCPADATCTGDADGDGCPYFWDDLCYIAQAWGTLMGQPGYLPCADLWPDGAIDAFDLSFFLASFGTGCCDGFRACPEGFCVAACECTVGPMSVDGDANRDSCVGPSDLGILLSSWELRCGDAGYQPCANFTDEGASRDYIDEADLGVLLGNWQTACGGAACQ
ncbi:MAG: hypothetical protein U1D55_09680 [Phycisphaerae bacterium]